LVPAGLQEVSRRSPGGLQEVSRRFPGGLQPVSRRFPAGLQEVSRRSPGTPGLGGSEGFSGLDVSRAEFIC